MYVIQVGVVWKDALEEALVAPTVNLARPIDPDVTPAATMKVLQELQEQQRALMSANQKLQEEVSRLKMTSTTRPIGKTRKWQNHPKALAIPTADDSDKYIKM